METDNDQQYRYEGAAVRAPIAAAAGDRPAAFEFVLAHHVPGRLRLRSVALKGNASASDQARYQLAQIRGVTATSANPTTGSVLLEYDPSVVSEERVIDLLAAQGYVLRATEVEPEAGSGWADRMASAVRDWVVNALAERLALAVITALA
jgi:copper chaperone CopZ